MPRVIWLVVVVTSRDWKHVTPSSRVALWAARCHLVFQAHQTVSVIISQRGLRGIPPDWVAGVSVGKSRNRKRWSCRHILKMYFSVWTKGLEDSAICGRRSVLGGGGAWLDAINEQRKVLIRGGEKRFGSDFTKLLKWQNNAHQPRLPPWPRPLPGPAHSCSANNLVHSLKSLCRPSLKVRT